MRIVGGAIAGDLAKDRRAARLRVLKMAPEAPAAPPPPPGEPTAKPGGAP